MQYSDEQQSGATANHPVQGLATVLALQSPDAQRPPAAPIPMQRRCLYKVILGALSPFGDVAASAALRLHLDPLDFHFRFYFSTGALLPFAVGLFGMVQRLIILLNER